MKNSLSRADRGAALRIILIYALVAALWIFLSDTVLVLFFHNPESITRIAIAKGFLFVIITSALLYHLIAREISARNKMEEELRFRKQQASEQASQLQTLLDTAPVHVLIARDRDCRQITGNRFANEFLRTAVGTNLSRSIAEPLQHYRICRNGEELSSRELPLQQVAASGQPLQEISFEYVFADGRIRELMGNVSPLFDANGQPAGAIGAFMDITELTKKEMELQEKNAEVERFVYMISHDLKSPLITIKAFLGYLEEDLANADAGRIENDLQYISSATDTMGRLIDKLQQMSKIGHLSNPPERVAFKELVDEVLQTVAGGITMGEVTVTVGDQPVILVGDRSQLMQIWQNLVENAVKFMGSQPAPRIEVGIENHDREAVFFVRDNGSGIDPRVHGRIFGLFEKLDPDAEGSGLGLAMVKRLVELYQGRIWLESAGEGSGACFRFTLPAACITAMKGDQA